MPVMDEFREEREALKHGTLKEKISYFIYYYKWHVVIVLAVIGVGASMIYQAVTHKDTVFYAALINAFAVTDTEEHIQGFADYAGIDRGAYDLMFDDSMNINLETPSQDTIVSSQKLMTYLAAGEIDVIISDGTVIDQYAYNDSFYDLREVLSPEQIERYEPYFFYMDLAVAEELHAAQEDPNYDYSQAPAHPDSADPGSMEKPVPVGIYLDGVESLNSTYYFTGNSSAVLAVAVTSPNRETAVRYIDFLYGQPAEQ